ncbi:hypothetical protein [Acidisoma sp.]|uniref:hypothetical protein n=1 Tax=Acidisoma sp. TaxID=1872115 RepID=UPI003B00722A
MFQKSSTETLTPGQPKASFWGFRRRTSASTDAAPAPADDTSFTADAISAGFEAFGRCGLQLGGLHRDQQWVGAWGGRC